MVNVVTVVGARPQFVKAAALSRAFRERGGVREVIVHTGQHFDRNMSEVFFEQMRIPRPDHMLAIHSLGHGAMTGRMLEGIEKVLLEERPDCLLVYGDTNSTLAGALAAVKLSIPVVHVEAGLRSFNMAMPEEINRILTDRVSRVLYCPTDAAVENLRREGFEAFGAEVVKTGDVMEDVARFYEPLSDDTSTVLGDNGLSEGGYYLCTLHRAENTADPSRMATILRGLRTLAESHPVVIPVHPRTRALLEASEPHSGVRLIDPVGYFDMIALIKNARLVVTDSGGLQKEAYFFDRFCITVRDQTEWVELVEHGVNAIVGADADRMVEAAARFESMKFDKGESLYGGGQAARVMADHLVATFGAGGGVAAR